MPILALLFILSGAAGLIYESVWARYISLLVGHSAYAQVIVLVIFLGGMALGSLLVGRASERIASPLLWYAIVEALVAVIALLFHRAFVGTTRFAYEIWLPSLSPGWPLTLATWSLAAMLILPKSVLLGATFPLMTAGAVRLWPERAGASLGVLYFANSFGAAIGALIGGFVLIGAVGMQGTLQTAAALNLLVAIGVVGVFVLRHPRYAPGPARETMPAPAPTEGSPAPGPSSQSLPAAGREALTQRGLTTLQRTLLAVSFATAFSSFLYEIAWTRMLSLVHGSATHSFELMLSAFILGLALGSLWISRRADAPGDAIPLLGKLHWAMGIAAIATLPLYILSFDWTVGLLETVNATDGGYRAYSLVRYAMTLAIMLPATFFAGTTLPLITRALMATSSGERAIGAVYGVNTIGSIVGAATAALLLVPLIGLKWVLVLGALIDIGVGIALVTWSDASRPAERPTGWSASHGRGAAIALTLAAVVGVLILTPFDASRLASGVYRYAVVPGTDVFRYLFYRDGRTASVAVRQVSGDTSSLLTIVTNGKPDASMSPALKQPYRPGEPKMVLDQDMTTQLLLPLLVLAHAPGARHGAVIGQGSGITSHILLASPSLERLHTIEIEPEMINGSRLFYPGNRRVFDDPRSQFAVDDARAFLSSSGPAFDLIVSEPSNPWVSGVSGLFTVEFYERVKRRLGPDGVFTQWFHLYEMDDASVASVLAGIDRVFGDYRVYLTSNADLVIVASAGERLSDADWSVTRWPELATDLAYYPPLAPATLDAAIMGSRASLHAFLREAPVNSDFVPLLDLNGERLRFRKSFANGFRELAEMRLDIPAALEGRSRGFAATSDNPTPDIYRAAALARGAAIRDTVIPADESVRRARYRASGFRAAMASGATPSDWREWLAELVAIEADLHGGTAGAADTDFFQSAIAYAERAGAPPAVGVSIRFLQALAAWNFGDAAAAGDLLIADLRAGQRWLPVEVVRRGTAIARLRTGDIRGAGRVYTSLSTVGGEWSLPDLVLEAYVRARVLELER